MKKIIAVLFVLMCLAQWYVPGAMIARQEDIAHSGKPFRFKTEPVDPYDLFRGKYITLSFEADTYPSHEGDEWRHGQTVFVILEEDARGFAKIGGLAATRPDAPDFLEAEIAYRGETSVTIRYPFNRFYLEESKAAAAETVYRQGSASDSTQNTYAIVRVKNGKAMLQDVMIDDKSIVDVVRNLDRN